MKNSTIQRAAASVLCTVIALAGLSACGSSSSTNEATSTNNNGERTETQSGSNSNSNEKQSEPEPTTLSEVLNGKRTIWFVGEKAVTKDSYADYVLVFDKGKVTTYSHGNYTYADFKGVPMNKILDKVKELDQKSFGQNIDRNVEENKKSIEKAQQNLSKRITCTWDYIGSPECPAKIQQLNETIARLEKLKTNYQSPEPLPFKIIGKTDETGNNLVPGERVYIKYRNYGQADGRGVNEYVDKGEWLIFFDLSLHSDPSNARDYTVKSVVYDKKFAGMSVGRGFFDTAGTYHTGGIGSLQMWQMYDDDSAEPAMPLADKLGAKGVTVTDDWKQAPQL